MTAQELHRLLQYHLAKQTIHPDAKVHLALGAYTREVYHIHRGGEMTLMVSTQPIHGKTELHPPKEPNE